MEEIRFQKEDIGGELLPILTTGLYRDALDTLREYIQNGIDAGATDISLKIDPDQIVIIDNGSGMTKEAARKAIRLGISDKNPISNVGFRGIGIYSAFNMCDEVLIYTKAAADITYKITFDFVMIRKEILKEQERRKNNRPSELYLEKLLNKSVKIEESSSNPISNTGTKIVLSGVLNEVYERLNNWEEVSGYLEKVVPLPFKSTFSPATRIREQFDAKDYPLVAVSLSLGGKKHKLYRPYSDDLFHFGGRHGVSFFELKHKNHIFGFAWICINDARSVLKNKALRGLSIKKFGFSVNDRSFLESFFPRTVLYRRMTGEIIIQSNGLIPNAARSDFEYNSTRQEFYQYLPKFIGEVSKWANEIQEEDLARDTLASVKKQLEKINRDLPSIRRNKEKLLLVNNNLQNIDREINPHRKILKRVLPTELQDAESLFDTSSNFVKSALTETQTSARKLEKEITASLAKRNIKLSDEEQKRLSGQPKTLVEVADAYGLLKDTDIKEFIEYIDETILQLYLSDKDYSDAITTLQLDLEA